MSDLAYALAARDLQAEDARVPKVGLYDRTPKPTPKVGWVCPSCGRVWAWWFPGPCDHGKAVLPAKEEE